MSRLLLSRFIEFSLNIIRYHLIYMRETTILLNTIIFKGIASKLSKQSWLLRILPITIDCPNCIKFRIFSNHLQNGRIIISIWYSFNLRTLFFAVLPSLCLAIYDRCINFFFRRFRFFFATLWWCLRRGIIRVFTWMLNFSNVCHSRFNLNKLYNIWCGLRFWRRSL